MHLGAAVPPFHSPPSSQAAGPVTCDGRASGSEIRFFPGKAGALGPQAAVEGGGLCAPCPSPHKLTQLGACSGFALSTLCAAGSQFGAGSVHNSPANSLDPRGRPRTIEGRGELCEEDIAAGRNVLRGRSKTALQSASPCADPAAPRLPWTQPASLRSDVGRGRYQAQGPFPPSPAPAWD